MFPFFRRKDNDLERRMQLEENLKRLREADIPVYYDPKERREKFEKQYERMTSQRKFQTRKVFIITILLVGFMYLTVLLIRNEKEKDFTGIDTMDQYVDIVYRWESTTEKPNQFRLIATLILKPELSEKVNLNDNVVFELIFYTDDKSNEESDGEFKEIFRQQFILEKKAVIDKDSPLTLRTDPISQQMKESIQRVEMAIETYFFKKKI